MQTSEVCRFVLCLMTQSFSVYLLNRPYVFNGNMHVLVTAAVAAGQNI